MHKHRPPPHTLGSWKPGIIFKGKRPKELLISFQEGHRAELEASRSQGRRWISAEEGVWKDSPFLPSIPSVFHWIRRYSATLVKVGLLYLVPDSNNTLWHTRSRVLLDIQASLSLAKLSQKTNHDTLMARVALAWQDNSIVIPLEHSFNIFILTAHFCAHSTTCTLIYITKVF